MLTYLIGVLDTENHVAAMHLREQIVVEESAQAANMHHASRAGGVAHSHSIFADVVRAKLFNRHLANCAIVGIDISVDIVLAHTRCAHKSYIERA